MDMIRPLIIALMIASSANAAADDWTQTYGVDLYGRSYHHDLAQGERDKLNESNIGFGLHSTIWNGKHSGTIETGTFLNTYYDQAYWVGAQYRYRLFKHFEPGMIVRHWETDHNTYPKKAISKYLTVSIPLTDTIRTQFIVRPSGYIAYLTIDIPSW